MQIAVGEGFAGSSVCAVAADKEKAYLRVLPRTVAESARRAIAAGEKLHKAGAMTIFRGRVTWVVVGTGEGGWSQREAARSFAGAAVAAASGLRARRVALWAPPFEGELKELAEAAVLASYNGGMYKSKSAPITVSRAVLVTQGKVPSVQKQSAAFGEILGRWTNYARNLANEPSNVLTPLEFVRRAQIAAKQSGLRVEAFGPDRMKKLGMGALLAVGRGSVNPPQFVVLRHGGKATPAIALIGKGVCFDTGGISLKPAEKMHIMKRDMAGAGAVLGAACALGEAAKAGLAQVPAFVACIPLAENMPSGSAYKPGDIVSAMNGTTIEVINTDAEGRLALADAVCYAKSLGAPALCDIATLTGGIRVALGSVRAGLFSNDDGLAAKVSEAADQAGEPLWRMPLDDEYRRLLDSEIADILNSGGRDGAPVSGAMFVKEFVGSTPWAHIDIAGTGWIEKPKPYMCKGASGAGVRTLAHLVLSLA